MFCIQCIAIRKRVRPTRPDTCSYWLFSCKYTSLGNSAISRNSALHNDMQNCGDVSEASVGINSLLRLCISLRQLPKIRRRDLHKQASCRTIKAQLSRLQQLLSEIQNSSYIGACNRHYCPLGHARNINIDKKLSYRKLIARLFSCRYTTYRGHLHPWPWNIG